MLWGVGDRKGKQLSRGNRRAQVWEREEGLGPRWPW